MNRSEIRQIFRSENPEITDRVVTDTVLNQWCKEGNKEICMRTKCIVSNESEEITAVVGTQYYDLLLEITNFYDIDTYPGGGVWYNDKALRKATAREMNETTRYWKLNSNGTPTKWFRRGKYLWFDRPPDAANTIKIDCVLLPDDFDSDLESPYNSLDYLEPFHPAVLKYLQYKAKMKNGKDQEYQIAKAEYIDYVTWMAKAIVGSTSSKVFMKPRELA